MSNQLICIWLGLPPESGWPPDHYRLLGLQPGEADPATIEQHVHQRLETVRRYQLTHPEQATAAMNRLAQAFVCLTDPQSKRAYDALLKPPGRRWVVVNGASPQLVLAEEAAEATQLDLTAAPSAPLQAQVDTKVEGPFPTVLPADPPSAPPREKIDPAVEAARSSPEARRGLGTKRALYRRIARTRQLLRAWEAVGKYMSDPEKRISRPTQATELIQQFTTIRTLLPGFPPLLGAAGQPGYLVIALARLQVVVPTFQSLLPSQREALARDWESGHKVLVAHREFLRQEIRARRKRSSLGRAYRAVTSTLTDQPGMILVLLALLALNVALWRQVNTSTWFNFFRTKPAVESSK